MIISSKEMVKRERGSPSLVNLRKKRTQRVLGRLHITAVKKNWIAKCCLGWPSGTNFTSLRRQILHRQDEEWASRWSWAVFQRLSKRHSGTVTSVFPFKVVLPSMMDLVIKQLWPILITHLGMTAWRDGCLPSIPTFKSPQPDSDHPVLPRTPWGQLSDRCSHVECKSPLFLYSVHLQVCRKKGLSTPES